MRKPFTKQLGCVALALVLLIAFLPSTVSAASPCTGLHKPDLTTLYPADWNDQTGGYGYDYYLCIDCGAACDKDGNPHVHVGPANGCSGGEKKHVPDLSNEEGADFTPCYGGFKVPHYHCIACGTVVDKDGTRLNPDPPTKQTHTPGTEEHSADYTPCNGGFQTNFYICVDCGNPVDINGAPMQVFFDSDYEWESFDIIYEDGELIINSLYHDHDAEPYCEDCDDYYRIIEEDGIEICRCECGHTISVEEYKAACEQYFENVYEIL